MDLDAAQRGGAAGDLVHFVLRGAAVFQRKGDVLPHRQADELAVRVLQHRADVERNIIFVSALFSNYTEFLPEKIAQFRKMNPTYRFRIEYKYTSIIVNDVLQGNSELGLCGNLSPDDPVLCSLDWRVIHKEPVGLIVGKNHPFAHRSSVSVEDLRDERFIVYIRSFRGTNQMLYDLCSPYGFEPNIAMEAYNDYGVLNSVASGDGIAIIPTTRFLERPDVVRIPLDLKEPLMRDLTLVWRKNEKLPPAAAAFRDMLISTAQ